MKTAKLIFSSAEDIKSYVAECENEYLSDVSHAAAAAKCGGNIITLAGPSCSGKTTTSLILDRAFERDGKTLHAVSIDDFYLDRDYLDARCRSLGIPIDYDSPSTIDFELFAKVIEQIEKMGKVRLPRFDFTVGKRVGYYEIECTDGDVFLFEGIQAVYKEFTSLLAGHSYTSLFISAGEKIACGDISFGQRELRLLRRLVRDSRTRATSAERTFTLWEGVCKNEDTHIFPNLTEQHVYIDSSMAYEISVIKPFVIPLLESIKNDSPHYEKAAKISKKLENIPIIDEKYVPDGSVFREFIGGNEN